MSRNSMRSDGITPRRTCADVASVGVHPIAVQALSDLQSSLVRVPTVPQTTAVTTVSSNAQQQQQQSMDSHHHLTSISLADRATHFITSEFICRVSFEDLFVGAVQNGGCSPKLPPARRLSTIQPPPLLDDDNDGDAKNVGGLSSSPDAHHGYDDGFRCIGSNAELEMDDMLWMIDNRKLTPEQKKGWQGYLLAEQESYEKQYQERCLQQQQHQHAASRKRGASSKKIGGHIAAPWPPPPPPPSSSVPRESNSADHQSNGGGGEKQHTAEHSIPAGTNSNNQQQTPVASSTLRNLNITLGAASPKQLSLLRRGVEATSVYLNAADQEERDFQAEVQEIKEDEVRRYCDRQAREIEEKAKLLLTDLDDSSHQPFQKKRISNSSDSSVTPNNSKGTSLLSSPPTSAVKSTSGGGFFSRFKLDGKVDGKGSQASKEASGSVGSADRGGDGLGGKLLSVFENLTRKAPPKDENGIPLTQTAIDEAAVKKQLLLLCPPICWRETLGLNIVTQWTYTLTIAVVKYCVVYRDVETNAVVDRSRAKEALRKLGSGNTVVAAAVAGISTTSAVDKKTDDVSSHGAVSASSPPSLGVTRSKELVVVRHVSKRVYGQPTKAQFHSKDHRNATGDVIDYPNIYFNIDDFDDDARLQDIKLCDGYTLAVLLTAGATRNSSAAIFRGALSYDVIMQRMKKHSKLFMGGGDNGSGGTRQSSSASLGGGSSSLFDGGAGDGGDVPKLFIPLIGPEKKGKAEMSVSIGEAERELSRQHQIYERQKRAQADADASSSSSSSFGEQPPSGSSFFDSFMGSNNKNANKGGSGIIGDTGGLGGGVGSTASSPPAPPPSTSSSSSFFSRQPSTSSVVEEATLQGNEAIQCSLTYVSVHAQHVMDALTNTEHERSRQWLTFPTSDEELTKILEMSSSV